MTVRVLLFSSLMLLLTACGIQASNPCTKEITSQFEDSQIASLSETFMPLDYLGASITNVEWQYSKRSDEECIATLTAEVNGVPVESYRWYIRTGSPLVHPDNQDAATLYAFVPAEQRFVTSSAPR